MGRIEDLLRTHSEAFNKPEPVKLIFMNGQFIRDIDTVCSDLKVEEEAVVACISKLSRIISQLKLTEDSSNTRLKLPGSKFLPSKMIMAGGSNGYYLPSSFMGTQSAKSLKLRQLQGFRTPQELTPETSVILEREKANKTSASAIKIDNNRYHQDILISLNQRDQRIQVSGQPEDHRPTVKVDRSNSKTRLEPTLDSSVNLKAHKPGGINPSADESAQEMITEFKKENLATKIESKQINSNDNRLQTPKFTVKESPVPTKAFKNESTLSPEPVFYPSVSVSPVRSSKKKNTLNISLATGINQTRIAPAEMPTVEKTKPLGSNMREVKQDNPRQQGSHDGGINKRAEQKDSQPHTKISGQELQNKPKPGYHAAGLNDSSNYIKFQVDGNTKAGNHHEARMHSSKHQQSKAAEDLLMNKTSLHEGVGENQDPPNLNMLFNNTSTIEPLSPTLLKKHSTNQSQLIFRGSSYENIQSHTLTNLDYFDANNTSSNTSARNKKKGNTNQQFVEFGDQQQNRGNLFLTRCARFGVFRV